MLGMLWSCDFHVILTHGSLVCRDGILQSSVIECVGGKDGERWVHSVLDDESYRLHTQFYQSLKQALGQSSTGQEGREREAR